MGGDEFNLLATDVRTAPAAKKERLWRRMESGIFDSLATRDPGGDATPKSRDGQDPKDEGDPVLRHVTRIGQDIRSAAGKSFLVQGDAGARAIEVSVSVGVAVYPTDSTNLLELCRIADQRMYEDKRQQKGSRGGLDRVLSLLTAS